MFWKNFKKELLYTALFCIFLTSNSLLHGNHHKRAILTENFSLVQAEDPAAPDVLTVHPKFSAIISDIHQLISRSYKSTKRDRDRHYLHQYMLEHNEDIVAYHTNHHWHCIKNFQGEQGDFVTTSFAWRLVRNFIRLFSGGHLPQEVDYPGFVAYSTDADKTGSIIWLVVVLRGSQGEGFQPGNGMFGGSWVTNYNAGSAELDGEIYPFTGYAHAGYLNKILSCNISMRNAINEALSAIGPANFPKVRFVVTGHSQGGGLAQVALPIIIRDHGYIYEKHFHNAETPRFFGYFMSTPRAISGKNTADAYIKYVGKNNAIRHQAYGDIVPMLCLSNYLPIGHLAVDTFYDITCRAIQSETAYCNRYMLFWTIKNLFDPDKFIINEHNNTWISKADPEFEINWTELCKVVCSQSALSNLSNKKFFRTFLQSAFRATHAVRLFENARQQTDISDEFLISLLKDRYDLSYVEMIMRCFAFSHDIYLESKKKERIFVASNNFEESFGNYERVGVMSAINNFRSLKNTTNFLNKFRDYDQFINHDLAKIVPQDGMVLNNRITPTSDSSAIAYAHYGSASNHFKSKLFDSNVPSKNLNLALKNGRELLRVKSNEKERCVFEYEEALPSSLFEAANCDR